MYISTARGKSKKFYPISAETESKVRAAVEGLFEEKHSFDSMQFYFIAHIMAHARNTGLSKAKQAEQVMLIHRSRYKQLEELTQKMKPADQGANALPDQGAGLRDNNGRSAEAE